MIYRCIILFCFLLVFNYSNAQNIINGDFSQIQNGKPSSWSISGDPANVTFSLNSGVDNGNPYGKLSCTKFTKLSSWSHCMLYQIEIRGDPS